MNWLINSLGRLLGTNSEEETWERMTTSIRQVDFEAIRKQSERNSLKPAYASGAMRSSESNATDYSKSKHHRNDIYPSVLNRLGGKFFAQRIKVRTKRHLL